MGVFLACREWGAGWELTQLFQMALWNLDPTAGEKVQMIDPASSLFGIPKKILRQVSNERGTRMLVPEVVLIKCDGNIPIVLTRGVSTIGTPPSGIGQSH